MTPDPVQEFPFPPLAVLVATKFVLVATGDVLVAFAPLPHSSVVVALLLPVVAALVVVPVSAASLLLATLSELALMLLVATPFAKSRLKKLELGSVMFFERSPKL